MDLADMADEARELGSPPSPCTLDVFPNSISCTAECELAGSPARQLASPPLKRTTFPSRPHTRFRALP
eukprot:5121773-Pleurochrysis_carterae.AAC.1